MRSLREYAHFVGRPQQPISPRTLIDYLRLNIDPHAVSLREVIEAFENELSPLSIGVIVEPGSGTVPHQVGMQLTNTRGYVIGLDWRILRGGQQIAVYDGSKNGHFPQVAHTFLEPGTYIVEAKARGIGKDGYAEVSRSATVVAKSQDVPPPTANRLKLILSPTELVPNTLRITVVNWKVMPMWNPAQVIERSGAEVEVTLPTPPASADARVLVELRIGCAVGGVLNGVIFEVQQFAGLAVPFPATIGLEGKPLTASWLAFWDMVPAEDDDDDPNNNQFRVDVVASLVNIS